MQSFLNYEHRFGSLGRAECRMLWAGCTLTPDKLVRVETRGVTEDQVLDLCPLSEWVRSPWLLLLLLPARGHFWSAEFRSCVVRTHLSGVFCIVTDESPPRPPPLGARARGGSAWEATQRALDLQPCICSLPGANLLGVWAWKAQFWWSLCTLKYHFA